MINSDILLEALFTASLFFSITSSIKIVFTFNEVRTITSRIIIIQKIIKGDLNWKDGYGCTEAEAKREVDKNIDEINGCQKDARLAIIEFVFGTALFMITFRISASDTPTLFAVFGIALALNVIVIIITIFIHKKSVSALKTMGYSRLEDMVLTDKTGRSVDGQASKKGLGKIVYKLLNK